MDAVVNWEVKSKGLIWKHVVNILLLGMVFLGIAMMADNTLGTWWRWLLRRLGCLFHFWFTKAFGLLLSFWGGLPSSGKLLWLSGLRLTNVSARAARRSAYKEAPPTRRRKTNWWVSKIPTILTSASILELRRIWGLLAPLLFELVF